MTGSSSPPAFPNKTESAIAAAQLPEARPQTSSSTSPRITPFQPTSKRRRTSASQHRLPAASQPPSQIPSSPPCKPPPLKSAVGTHSLPASRAQVKREWSPVRDDCRPCAPPAHPRHNEPPPISPDLKVFDDPLRHFRHHSAATQARGRTGLSCDPRDAARPFADIANPASAQGSEFLKKRLLEAQIHSALPSGVAPSTEIVPCGGSRVDPSRLLPRDRAPDSNAVALSNIPTDVHTGRSSDQTKSPSPLCSKRPLEPDSVNNAPLSETSSLRLKKTENQSYAGSLENHLSHSRSQSNKASSFKPSENVLLSPSVQTGVKQANPHSGIPSQREPRAPKLCSKPISSLQSDQVGSFPASQKQPTTSAHVLKFSLPSTSSSDRSVSSKKELQDARSPTNDVKVKQSIPTSIKRALLLSPSAPTKRQRRLSPSTSSTALAAHDAIPPEKQSSSAHYSRQTLSSIKNASAVTQAQTCGTSLRPNLSSESVPSPRPNKNVLFSSRPEVIGNPHGPPRSVEEDPLLSQTKAGDSIHSAKSNPRPDLLRNSRTLSHPPAPSPGTPVRGRPQRRRFSPLGAPESLERSPSHRRSESPIVPRKNLLRTEKPPPKAWPRSSRPDTSTASHRSPAVFRLRRRYQDTPSTRRSHSPEQLKHRSRSPSARRKSPVASRAHRYARSPSRRGRAYRSPPAGFRRSGSPFHSGLRSLSPPYRDRRSRSPLNRDRRSPLPSYRSRRSLSPPYHNRRSPSPPYRCRRFPSPLYQRPCSSPRSYRKHCRSPSPSNRDRHSPYSRYRGRHSPSHPIQLKRTQSSLSYRDRSRSPPSPTSRKLSSSINAKSMTPSGVGRRSIVRSPSVHPQRPSDDLDEQLVVARKSPSLSSILSATNRSSLLHGSGQTENEKEVIKFSSEEDRPIRSLGVSIRPHTSTRDKSGSSLQKKLARRVPQCPSPARMVDKGAIFQKRMALPLNSTENPMITSIRPIELRMSKNIPKSSTKVLDGKSQDLSPKANLVVSSDVAPHERETSCAGMVSEKREKVSACDAMQSPRPSRSKDFCARPPLIPFDPFFFAPKIAEKDSSKEQDGMEPSEKEDDDETHGGKGMETDDPHEPEIVSYMIQYGLHVIERDPSNREVTWLGCKFCPLFGALNRSKKYLMVFVKPFSAQVFIRHLNSSHKRVWSIYSKAPKEAKLKLFEGRTLPPDFLFSLRIASLKNGNHTLGDKTLEQQRVFSSPTEVKNERIEEYRKIATKEAAENERRLAVLEKSTPSQSEKETDGMASMTPAKISNAIQDHKGFNDARNQSKQSVRHNIILARNEHRKEISAEIEKGDLEEDIFARKRSIQEDEDIRTRTQQSDEYENRSPAGRQAAHLTNDCLLGRQKVEPRADKYMPCFVQFIDREKPSSETPRGSFEITDPELFAGRAAKAILYPSLNLTENIFDRLPPIGKARLSIEALRNYTEKWLSMFQYGVSDEPGISEIVLEGELSHNRTQLQSTSESYSHERNQCHWHLNDQYVRGNMKHKENLDLFSLVLFYLLRGICVDAIAFLVAEISECTMIQLCGEDEDVSGLVHSIGNSILVASLRLARSITENQVTSWGVALRTGVCHEVDGIEISLSIHLTEWRTMKIHIVSVRRARGAAEVASRILDNICNDWRNKLMGISSGIPVTSPKAKKMERILFAEFQEIVNIESHLILVDADLPKEARPIYANVLTNMSHEEFGTLLQQHQKRLRNWFEDDDELEKLKSQWRHLCTYPKQEKDISDVESTWPQSRRIRSIMNFAQVLSALWKYDIPTPQGCTEVGKVDCSNQDCSGLLCPNLERIYWTRTFVNLIQEKENCFSGICPPHIGSQWFSNWSNWEATSEP